jgi:hypothetical protein
MLDAGRGGMGAVLAGLLDPDAVGRLPDDERDACRQLWADAGALLRKAGGER